jgi:hypothetical protein
VTGQQAELSAFSSARQQAAFMASAKALGATVTAQGRGWVVTGGTAAPANTLACSTVVDPGGSGLRGHNLTAKHVIADLEAMLLIDGIRNIEPTGTPSTDDANILAPPLSIWRITQAPTSLTTPASSSLMSRATARPVRWMAAMPAPFSATSGTWSRTALTRRPKASSWPASQA